MCDSTLETVKKEVENKRKPFLGTSPSSVVCIGIEYYSVMSGAYLKTRFGDSQYKRKINT